MIDKNERFHRFGITLAALLCSLAAAAAASPRAPGERLTCIPGRYFPAQGYSNQLCLFTKLSREELKSADATTLITPETKLLRCHLENGASVCSNWTPEAAEKIGVDHQDSVNQIFGKSAEPRKLEAQPETQPKLQPEPAPKPTVAIRPTAAQGAGGRIQDCALPQGPIAYNIGSSRGTGVSCNARSIVVGFGGDFNALPRGVTGVGYINPLVENAEMRARFLKGAPSRMGNAIYGEPMFLDYSSQGAQKYIEYQVQHWKKAAQNRRGSPQKCVAVDVNNCDVIGTKNYGHVLDVIDRLNKADPEGVQIRVLVKNPQNSKCRGFMKRSVVIGAFIEEISPSEVNLLTSSVRANPDQVLLFARGNQRGAEHASLASLAARKIPNSSVSFDTNGEYQSVTKCTYAPPVGGRNPESVDSDTATEEGTK